jgi:hypothetical protein
MTDLSNFESRIGKVTCSAEELFSFVTDIRNFERFIPQGTINTWQADNESCSFSVSMIGTVSFRIAEKEMFRKVAYDGDALKENDFSLVLDISEKDKSETNVKVLLSADLNPMLKMMAAKPISQFLEMLINEMETFREWKEIRK